MLEYTKNVDDLLRLRHSRYRQTPNNLKRANAHASGVNYLLKFLIVVLKFGEFRMTRIKSGRSSLLSLFCLCYVTISDLFF